MSVFATILSLFGVRRSQAEEQTEYSAEAIARARDELTHEFVPDIAIAGEPRLVDRSGEFAQRYDAIVPLECPADITDPAPLTFDVEGDDLERFCEAMGVTVDTIGDVEGERIPIQWTDGTPVPCWDRLDEE